MNCPNCNFTNPDGVRFCGQCAAEIHLPCPSCGFENPGNFKYCGQCAAMLTERTLARTGPLAPAGAIRDLAHSILQPPQGGEGERRNITVVFVDIRSFTPFAEKLDPEDVYAAVDLYMRALVEQVNKYGGHVDKFTGDGLMALFGAPVAHEDDPERGVRAAWEMQQALRRLAAQESWAAPVALNARIGVSSGPVVVAEVGSEDGVNYTAIGDVVNVAARLEQNAEPGSILISASTYEHTRQFFAFEAMGPLAVKGRKEPVETYRLVGEKERPGPLRGWRNLSSDLIGRQDELQRLHTVVRDLIEHGRGGVVLISGEAGIGKSRLTAELRNDMDSEGATFLLGESVSYGQYAPYAAFARILRRFFGIRSRDSAEQTRAEIHGRLLAIDSALVGVSEMFIANLLELPLSERESNRLQKLDPQLLRRQTFLAVRALLTAAAREYPLVLVFEDLHWIDELSLELLLFLINDTDQAPILLYGATRPQAGTAAERIREIAQKRLGDRFLALELRPLPAQETTELARSMLSLTDLPAAIRTFIVDKSEGNPFFTEELVGALIDQGIFLRATEAGWMVRPGVDIPQHDTPVTLEGLIMARVDSIGPHARRILQYAAILGRQFSLPMLQYLTEDEVPELQSFLLQMEERGFLAQVADSAQQLYEFRHGLTRESVYNSLLLRRRRELHGRAVMAIENIDPTRLQLEPELIAYHFTHSNAPERARAYLIEAGHRARKRFANQEAIEHYETALELLYDDSPDAIEQRIEVAVGLGDVCSFLGKYEQAAAVFGESLAATEQMDAPSAATLIADIQRRLGRVCERQGDHDQAMRWIESALDTLSREGTAPTASSRALILKEKGWLHFRRGNYEEALNWITQSTSGLRQSGLSSELASAYNSLAALYYNSGRSQEALAYAEKGLQLRDEIGDTYGVANSHNNLGNLAVTLGEWEQARSHYEQCIKLYGDTGNREGGVFSRLNLAWILIFCGELEQAQPHLDQALEEARAISNGYLISSTLSELGELAFVRGAYQAAMDRLAESEQISAEVGAQEVLAEARWRAAQVQLTLGDLVRAEEFLSSAIELAAEAGAKEALGDALRIRGALCVQTGEFDAAREAFEESISIFSNLRHKYKAALSRFELGRGLMALNNPEDSAEAARLMSQAIAAFEELGARPDIENAHALLLQAQRISPHSNAANPFSARGKILQPQPRPLQQS